MPAPQDPTPFTENSGMPTPVREPFPKTLLTSVNTKSETLKAFSAFPQSRFHSHPFPAATSLSGPYFEAVSLQTSSALPGLQSTGAQGALCPQKALGPTAPLAGEAPGPAPAPLPRGPQPPLRSRPPTPAAASGRCPAGLPLLQLAYGTPLPRPASAARRTHACLRAMRRCMGVAILAARPGSEARAALHAGPCCPPPPPIGGRSGRHRE